MRCREILILGLLFGIVMTAGGQAAESVSTGDYFVSTTGSDASAGSAEQPFATISRAQDAVREEIRTGLKRNITVWICGGEYILEHALRFGVEDSGTQKHSITYTARPGEKVVLSGGRRIEGWKEGENHLWHAELPQDKTGQRRFRDVFANGKRLTRARFPNAGHLLTVKGIEKDSRTYSVDQTIPAVQPEQDTEAVFYRSWCLSRVLVEGIHGEQIVTRDSPDSAGHPNRVKKGRTVFLEHAREFLDEPGEWFLDQKNGVVYYQARAGEDPRTMEFIVPRLETLLEIEGTSGQPVLGLQFVGLELAHTDWNLPDFGYRSIQACLHGPEYQKKPAFSLPVAVKMIYARKCSFENARFTHFGACGVGMGRGCRNNQILGCEFEDIGGNAVMVGWHPQEDAVRGQWLENLNPDWANPADAPSGNEITHNFIHHGGTVHKGAVAIWIAFSPQTQVCRNLICHWPYTGISVGFIWSGIPTTQRDNRIAFNYIHHVMEEMLDGAAVYTLGYQPGTRIENNLIHDVISPKSRGLYTDEGSGEIVLEKNLCYRLGDYAYLHHYGQNNFVRNNIFASPGKAFVNRYRGDERASFAITRNIFWSNKPVSPVEGVFEGNEFFMDYNLYGGPQAADWIWDGGTWTDWNSRGHDRHSILADPRFVNPENGDFHLSPDSTARELGFEPLDLSEVGPQGQYRRLLQDRMKPYCLSPMVRN